MTDAIYELKRAPTPAITSDRSGLSLAIEPLGMAKLRIHGAAFDDRFASIAMTAPPPPRRQVEHAGLTIAWMAPGEWLIAGEEAAVADWLGKVDAEDALAVDITHARTSFVLGGPDARVTIAAHCPLDLRPHTFPVDAVARTIFGETTMFIARLADREGHPRFRLVFDQTMALYAARMVAGR